MNLTVLVGERGGELVAEQQRGDLSVVGMDFEDDL